MGQSHKAERAKEKVLTRQLAGEVGYVSREAERLEPLISLAVAEELAGDYSSAVRDYTAAFEIATGVAKIVESSSIADGGLADVVQNTIKLAQAGVLEIQLKSIAAEYFGYIGNKAV